VRRRSLLVAPVVLMLGIGLAGCDSKAGIAAQANGHRIAETELAKYVGPNAAPIPLQNNATAPARTFVLNTLITDEVVPEFLRDNGGDATAAELAAARASLLQGGSEQDLTEELGKVGLNAAFEPIYLKAGLLRSIVGTRFKSQADFDAALKKFTPSVSVNRRYGSWDTQTLGLTDLSSKDLPSFVKIDGGLPGDQTPTQ